METIQEMKNQMREMETIGEMETKGEMKII